MGNRDVFNPDDTDAIEISTSITINENITSGDILRSKIAGAHGLAEKASSSGTSAILGVAEQGGSVGGTISMIQSGIGTVNFTEASLSSSDIGKAVFVSDTSGKGTITAPSSGTIIRLGYLKTTGGEVLISPQILFKYS